jgi:hypothetical protein
MAPFLAVLTALLLLILAFIPAWELTQYFLHIGRYDRRVTDRRASVRPGGGSERRRPRV